VRRTTKAHRGPPIDMDPAWPRSLSPLFSVTTTMTFAHETLSSQGFAESLADIIMVQAPLKSHCYKNSLSPAPSSTKRSKHQGHATTGAYVELWNPCVSRRKAIPPHKHFLYGVALPVSSAFTGRRGVALQNNSLDLGS